jgi:hypothetical protein
VIARTGPLLAAVLLAAACQGGTRPGYSGPARASGRTSQAAAANTVAQGPRDSSRSAQSPEPEQQKRDERAGYIAATFLRNGMELPRLGWIVPPNTVITREYLPHVYVYSDSASVEQARWQRRVTPAELRRLRETAGIACGRASEHNRYALPDPKGQTQAEEATPGEILYTAHFLVKGPSDVSTTETSAKEIADGYSLFAVNRRGTLTKAFDVAADGWVFTMIGFYDDQSNEMFAEGMILYDASKKVVGSESWDVSDDTVCEGCDVPAYDDDLEDEFPVLNVYRIPHFAAPLLLEDTSFGQTGALSLVTFDADGNYAEYRLTEDLGGCGEPAPPNGVLLAGFRGPGLARPGVRRPYGLRRHVLSTGRLPAARARASGSSR